MKKIFLFGLFAFGMPVLLLAQSVVLPSDATEVGDQDIVGTRDNVARSDGSKFYRYPKAEKKKKYNIAVFTPMFLDSVELADKLTRIPDFMKPGLDFYQGVEIAADTLRRKGYHFDIHVFDSRAKYMDINNVIASDKLDSMDLIIGNASIEDLKELAEYSRKREINFISAVSPSSADQEFNPFFTILQPTLETHVQELHRTLIKKYPEDNVIYIYRNQGAEANALDYFENDIYNATPGRFHKMAIAEDVIDIAAIKKLIDSNYHTTIVLGVLNPKAAYEILKALVPLAKDTRLKVFGMPTLEMINTLDKTNSFPNMKIFYTTAFVVENLSPATKYILRKYAQKMGGTHTDLVYKGFESVYFFANLMQHYGVPFNEHISDNRFSFLTPFKILPDKEDGKFQYYENKFLYLLSFENGVMSYE